MTEAGAAADGEATSRGEGAIHVKVANLSQAMVAIWTNIRTNFVLKEEAVDDSDGVQKKVTLIVPHLALLSYIWSNVRASAQYVENPQLRM